MSDWQSTNSDYVIGETSHPPSTTMELFLRQQAAYREITRGLRRQEELPYSVQEEDTLP